MRRSRTRRRHLIANGSRDTAAQRTCSEAAINSSGFRLVSDMRIRHRYVMHEGVGSRKASAAALTRAWSDMRCLLVRRAGQGRVCVSRGLAPARPANRLQQLSRYHPARRPATRLHALPRAFPQARPAPPGGRSLDGRERVSSRFGVNFLLERSRSGQGGHGGPNPSRLQDEHKREELIEQDISLADPDLHKFSNRRTTRRCSAS